jgi:hypothetical protein
MPTFSDSDSQLEQTEMKFEILLIFPASRVPDVAKQAIHKLLPFATTFMWKTGLSC